MIKLVKSQFSKKTTPQLLQNFGITMPRLHRNLQVPKYYQYGIPYKIKTNTPQSLISDCGGYVAFSGQYDQVSIQNRRIVRQPIVQKDINWGKYNIPLQRDSFKLIEQMAAFFLNTRQKLYVVDGYIGWDINYRMKVRVVTSKNYHALFMNNLLIKPTIKQLQTDFQEGCDLHIFNAGQFPSNQYIDGIKSPVTIAHNLDSKKIVILGTQYAGQMKYNINYFINYIYPKKGLLPLKASCNQGSNGQTALLLGQSLSGKSMLSTHQQRTLISDDQIVWSNNGVFNVQGGCYPRVLNLNKNIQPITHNAIRFGTLIQNAAFYDTDNRKINYFDSAKSNNTRACYPLNYVDKAEIPAIGNHPRQIIFLVNDAHGVLPFASKLSTQQAIYHFISGYSSIIYTKDGIKMHSSSFSTCFNQQYLPYKSNIYIDMFIDRIKKHEPQIYMINTGYCGGKYTQGKRYCIQKTEDLLLNIYDNKLTQFKKFQVFGFEIPSKINGIENFHPKEFWNNKNQYIPKLQTLAKEFKDNYSIHIEKYAQYQIGGPQ